MTWEAWLTCGLVIVMLWSLARGVAGADLILMSGALFAGLAEPHVLTLSRRQRPGRIVWQ